MESLLSGQRADLVADGDAIQEIGMAGAPQHGAKRVLAGEQDLQRRPDIDGRTDQQSQVGQSVPVKQMGFVEDEQQRSFGPGCSFEDLFIETILASPARTCLIHQGDRVALVVRPAPPNLRMQMGIPG